MSEVIAWITVNWWWLVIALGVLIQILNAVTKHWSEQEGVVKFFTFLAEVLSIVVSQGSQNGKMGALKLPLTSIPPKNVDKKEEKPQ